MISVVLVFLGFFLISYALFKKDDLPTRIFLSLLGGFSVTTMVGAPLLSLLGGQYAPLTWEVEEFNVITPISYETNTPAPLMRVAKRDETYYVWCAGTYADTLAIFRVPVRFVTVSEIGSEINEPPTVFVYYARLAESPWKYFVLRPGFNTEAGHPRYKILVPKNTIQNIE